MILSLSVGSAFAGQVTVVEGDNLWVIAYNNGTTVQTLRFLNGLTDNNIYPGMVLQLPEEQTEQVVSQAARPPSQQTQVSRGIVDRSAVVLEFAQQFIGTRYRSGGSSPNGFDCSGYVRYVFNNFGINLVHTAAGQYKAGTVIKKEELTPGDLVFFNTGGYGINHSGIYIGNDQFIHASSSRGIRIDSMLDNYWSPRYRGANRILPQ